MAQGSRVGDAVVGGIVTLIGSAILVLATGAWTAKENVSDHRADIQAIRAELRRVRDVVCLGHKDAPQCSDAGVSP